MAAGVDRNLRAITLGLAIFGALAAAIWFGSWQAARVDANEHPQNRGTVAGFTTYAVPAAKFSIAVPQSWRTFTADEVFADGEALDELERENPEFAQYRDALSDPRSPMKLVALDPNVRGGFATNVNVVAQDVPDDVSFEDFAQANEAELRTLTAITSGLESDEVNLPAGRAQRLTYQARFTFNGQERSIATLQYGLVANGWTYVITYTALPEFADEYRNDFERSANSFSAG
jgi:hypothetical protein